MTLILPLLLFLLFVAIAATLYPEGMWGNAITLINVVTAALLATNFWEPLAKLVEQYVSSFTFFWDYLMLWALFAVIFGIMRAVTDKLSRTKVRFIKVADQVGGAFFAAWVGWVMVCFTAMSLHMAPLARNFMFGGFDPESHMMAGLAPDRQWLGFMQRMSYGPFSRTLAPAERDQNTHGRSTDAAEQGLAVFDRNADFLPKYATRRATLQDYVETKKVVRVPETEYGSLVPKR